MDTLAASEPSKLAARIVEKARAAGADVAEVSVDSGWQLSARVRLGKTELLEEAGTRSVALRVMRDQRVSVTSTSDLSTMGIDRCVSDALMLAKLSEPDELAGPAEVAELCGPPHPNLSLYDDGLASLTADDAIEWAQAAERAALQTDPRLTLSEGATFARSATSHTLVLSSGFSGTVKGTQAWLDIAISQGSSPPTRWAGRRPGAHSPSWGRAKSTPARHPSSSRPMQHVPS
jgi:PmbA protein